MIHIRINQQILFLNSFQYPVIKINLKSINSLIQRRFLLQQIVSNFKPRVIFFNIECNFNLLQGLEIKWRENDNERLLYVSFRNQSERDEFFEMTMQQDCVKITQTEPESMTLKWQNGVISNYDYLLYLNR